MELIVALGSLSNRITLNLLPRGEEAFLVKKQKLQNWAFLGSKKITSFLL